MNVSNKVVRGLAVSVLMTMMVGCAGVDGAARKEFSNNNKIEGVVYGFRTDFKTASTEDVCKAINNADLRCADMDKYQVVRVMSEVGYASGFMGSVALAPKDMDVGGACSRGGSSECTFIKVKVEKNKLGTVLAVASRPGDGKCHWSGLAGMGGTVCRAYGWDYSKDNQAAIVQ